MYTRFITRAFRLLIGVAISFDALAQNMSDFESYPPYIAEKKDPLVMLAMSLDHQLFYKAYTDYDDLYDDPTTTADDNVPENTYHPEVDYIGYFDHAKCYEYDTAKKHFEPTTLAVAGSGVSNPQYCSNAWSGNFLNWAAMTRIDVVRKVLYGGMRSLETSTETVLERSHLPNDAHSFAKYYNGADLDKLIPSSLVSKLSNNACSKPAAVADANAWDNYIACRQGQGITFCNTTVDRSANVYSQASQADPLIRAIPGNYSLWAANERYQCLYGFGNDSGSSELKHISFKGTPGSNFNEPGLTEFYAYAENPPETSNPLDYVARVVACKSGVAEGEESCKTYTNASGQNVMRPIGLLQEFGGHGSDGMDFGLITGSYKYSKSFGKLRSNIGDISGEINPADGTFTNAEGLINTLNSLRIANYQFNITGSPPFGITFDFQGTYNNTSGDDCVWGRSNFVDGQCTNWGNPFSEIMFEGYRYLSGASGPFTNQLQSDDSLGGTLANIPDNVTWDTSISDLECKSLNMVGFNASSVSYDGDIANVNLADAGIGTESVTVAAATNVLTPLEIVTGTKYFFGEVNGVFSPPNSVERQQCTAKTITNLADVRGICPDSPRLGGTYFAAGIAHHVQSKGVRGSSGGASVPIRTFGVNLAPALPKLNIPVPGRSAPIVLQPACRNMGFHTSDNFSGNCAIVDFKIIEPYSESAGIGTGSVYVVWEDSEQGGDYDMDASGLIQYRVSNTELTLSSTVFEDTTPFSLGFGYVISGLGNADDGFYSPASTLSNTGGPTPPGTRDYSAPGKYGCPHGKSGTSNSECTIDGEWSRHTLAVSPDNADTSVAFLESPLYYAAKWGNLDSDGDPRMEGDRPETYYDVRNPAELNRQMQLLFRNIANSETAASGSGVAVNDTNFNSLAVQSVFYPRITDGDDEVAWVGSVHAMLVSTETDTSGNQRVYLVEDSNQNGLLDDTDRRINRLAFDEEANRTYAEFLDGSFSEISDIKALWNAQKSLEAVANYTTQRTWGARANTARYVIGAVDKNGDGQIVPEEVLPFTDAVFSGQSSVEEGLSADNYRFLDVSSGDATDAQNVVNFIRGQEGIAGFRSRTAGNTTFLLGDTVHSTPLIVGSPSGNFYEVHGDIDYLRFYQTYYNRRNVTYVGANDGMLHAFNAGFPSIQRQGFDLSSDNGTTTDTTDDPVAHALGAELWSYVPFNLLPHLKWLTSPIYRHVAYVDAAPQVFDVKIFDEDSDARHVGGWGTILVVGMRMGGGDYDIDPDGTGTKAAQTLRSAYVILDITDPEQPPRLLGEITDPNLGFTAGEVDVVYRDGKWSLVFGSGPDGADALSKATSTSNARLFSLNLNALASGSVNLQSIDTGVSEAFVGGVRAVDWNRDLNTDALYFGLVGGKDDVTGAAQKGRLMRARITDTGITGVSQFLSGVDAAFAETPVTVTDSQRNYWVFAGEGRFYVDADDQNSGELKAYYGVKESIDILTSTPGPIARTSLMDVSEIQTNLEEGLVIDDVVGATAIMKTIGGAVLTDADGNTASASTHTELANYMTQREVVSAAGATSPSPIRGWMKTYRNTGELTATKTLVDPTLFSLVFNSYTPTVTGSACPLPGNARSYSLDLRTGVFNGYYVNVNIDPSNPADRQKPLSEQDTVKTGVFPQDPALISGVTKSYSETGKGGVEDEGTRSLDIQPGRRSWQEIPMDTFYNW